MVRFMRFPCGFRRWSPGLPGASLAEAHLADTPARRVQRRPIVSGANVHGTHAPALAVFLRARRRVTRDSEQNATKRRSLLPRHTIRGRKAALPTFCLRAAVA